MAVSHVLTSHQTYQQEKETCSPHQPQIFGKLVERVVHGVR